MASTTGVDFTPPPLPPPLLVPDQVAFLSQYGYLPAQLPSKLLQLHHDLQAASKAFFALTHDVKESTFPASQGTELGYYHVKDEKEYVTFRHASQAQGGLKRLDSQNEDRAALDEISEATTRLERTAAQLWFHTAACLHRMLLDLSRSLAIDPESWEPVLDGCLCSPPSQQSMTPSLLRTFLYEPNRGTAAPHKDNGLLTLCVGTEQGLQVWQDHPEGPEVYGGLNNKPNKDGNVRRGRWIDASGPTVLIGTALHLLSDCRLPAGTHQVVANPRGRQSIVFALRPSTRHAVDLSRFGARGIISMKKLWQRIVKGRVNVNAHKSIRDTQEQERQERFKRHRNTQKDSNTVAVGEAPEEP